VTSKSNVVSVETLGVINIAVEPLEGVPSSHFAAGAIDVHSPLDARTSSWVVHSCRHVNTAPSALPSVENKMVDGTLFPDASMN
jgi:hypothetical protein